MNKEVNIRQYKDNDYPQIVQLMREFQKFLTELDTEQLTRETSIQEEEEYTQLLLRDVHDKEGIFYVAEHEEKLVGFVCGIIQREPSRYFQLTYKLEVQGWIGELFVMKQYRDTGLGKRLVQEIETYFQNTGCTACWLKVAADNVSARKFYSKAEYIEREIELRKALI